MESLPNEVLCAVLELLPPEHVAVAARTCRRWWGCSPLSLRSRLSRRALQARCKVLAQWSREEGCAWDELTCMLMASEGRLDLLQWARQGEQKCPWDSRTCEAAAEAGHFELLRWAIKEGCCFSQATAYAAVRGGHVDILRWAKEQGFYHNLFEVSELAALHGHLHILQ